MRISELITQLDRTKATYGDKPIDEIVLYNKDVFLINPRDTLFSIGNSDDGISIMVQTS
jgi:hypothetical protein